MGHSNNVASLTLGPIYASIHKSFESAHCCIFSNYRLVGILSGFVRFVTSNLILNVMNYFNFNVGANLRFHSQILWECTLLHFFQLLSGRHTIWFCTGLRHFYGLILYLLLFAMRDPVSLLWVSAQWFEMPDHLRKLILRSDCWKQVKCAWFLSAKASFCLKKLFRATKAKKANEGKQRPAKSKTSNFFVIITFSLYKLLEIPFCWIC